MSFDADDTSEWLGAEVEKSPDRPLVCPAVCQQILVKAFQDKKWPEDDTVDDDCKPADVELWVAILKDAAVKHKTDLNSADLFRFKRWLWAHKVKDEDGDDVSTPRPSSVSKTARTKVRPPIGSFCS